MNSSFATTDLVPVTDRLRWTALCRAGIVAALTAVWLGSGMPYVSPTTALMIVAGWLMSSALALFAVRAGRRFALWILNVGLFCDAVLLVAVWWMSGGLGGPAGYLVILHLIATTLLASFRTGVKVALWHCILVLLTLEASAAEVLGRAQPVPMWPLTGYLAVVWITVLATASFGAMNERELRRRRYDSEVLRQLATVLAGEDNPRTVAATLARFAQDELLVARCAVVVYTSGSADSAAEGGFAASLAVDGSLSMSGLRGPLPDDSLVQTAISKATPIVVPGLASRRDPVIATVLPVANHVIVVPFAVEHAVGALVMEQRLHVARRSALRVKRRMVNTAEQATLQAALAIGRGILTQRLRAAADTDGLTGVANRRRFDASLAAAIEGNDGTVAVVLIDLDHFKQLNDRHGHLVGDEALRAAARAIAAACGDRGIVARYGGEEFVAILPNADLDVAHAVAQQIRHAILNVGFSVPMSASLGVAVYPEHGRRPEILLKAADTALYEAKSSGRNRVSVAGSVTAGRVTAGIAT